MPSSYRASEPTGRVGGRRSIAPISESRSTKESPSNSTLRLTLVNKACIGIFSKGATSMVGFRHRTATGPRPDTAQSTATGPMDCGRRRTAGSPATHVFAEDAMAVYPFVVETDRLCVLLGPALSAGLGSGRIDLLKVQAQAALIHSSDVDPEPRGLFEQFRLYLDFLQFGFGHGLRLRRNPRTRHQPAIGVAHPGAIIFSGRTASSNSASVR
jgi:hypothetical protein